ncbi:uncharacterized protein LOC135369104 [Ornithodoros turicata]|uniref:uncharacterized protein LOC135369104 n=1 Tax=Ornithodoros turicata TaxID=34597 RepID=UPI003138D79D
MSQETVNEERPPDEAIDIENDSTSDSACVVLMDHCYLNSSHETPRCEVTVAGLTNSDAEFYTGLQKNVLLGLIKAVEKYHTRFFWTPVPEQVLLCLMRLRLGLLYGDLARRFDIIVTRAAELFKYIISLLVRVMKYVVVWLPRSRIASSMPQVFVDTGYGGTTCILDCTEVMLQRPRKLMPRAQTYSAYKAHNTVKFLVAIAPNGYIMFVSRGYGGRASDKYIMHSSGLSSILQPGDEAMADRGFPQDPELAARGVKYNVPAFTKGLCNLKPVLIKEK